MREQCGYTLEGHRFASGIVMWRRRCRNRPVKGMRNCWRHLTVEEQEEYDRRKGRSWTRPR